FGRYSPESGEEGRGSDRAERSRPAHPHHSVPVARVEARPPNAPGSESPQRSGRVPGVNAPDSGVPESRDS
ncbi:MAG: hypothetical protein ACE5G6_07585, partial [Terriglobia bacterium]